MRREPGRTRARVWELGEAALREGVADDVLRLWLTAEEEAALRGAMEAGRRSLLRAAKALGSARAAGAEGVPASVELPPSLRAAETFSRRLQAVPCWVGLLRLLEDYAATWDDPAGLPRRAEDRIYGRDGWRCVAPGCTSRRGLKAHHLHYRSRGGLDDEWNLATRCGWHHRAGEHGTLLRVKGEAPLGLTFRLGRPGCHRWFRNERRVAAEANHAGSPVRSWAGAEPGRGTP